MTNKNNIKINNIKNKTNGEPYIWASYLEETLLSDFLKYIYGASVSETQIYEWVSVSKTMMSKEIKTE